MSWSDTKILTALSIWEVCSRTKDANQSENIQGRGISRISKLGMWYTIYIQGHKAEYLSRQYTGKERN